MRLSELADVVRALPSNPLGALSRLYRRPLPDVEGRTRVTGVRAPVEIVRDRWGVPHIYAQSAEDALFAQGYVHAQDRLWQLELNRRVGHGRLAEAFGAVAFETDRLLRTIGLGRAAHRTLAHVPDESHALLSAYARGVNAWLAKRRKPLELTLLGIEPEPWEPIDTLAWANMMAWGLSANWDAEVVSAALVAKLGPERAARLRGEYPREHPIVMPDHTWAPMLEELQREFTAAGEWLPGVLAGVSGMSNNWVVDGEKSATGRPILCNDPHLGLQMPSIWYEVHLHAPGFEVAGVSLPGSAGVVIGHNAHVAWGFTAALADAADLYVERFDPAHPHRYEHQGAWLDAEVVREQVRVKGEAPRTVEIVLTRHGPIVNQLTHITASRQPHALALRWTGHDENRIYRAPFALARAKNGAELRAALADWDAPSMNCVWADDGGNIGYQLCGRIPIRARGPWRVPVPGWTGEHEWTGFIPHEELPHVENPPAHFLATANNLLAGKERKHFLGSEVMSGWRARRITEVLASKERLTLDDMARLQVDQHSGASIPLTRLLVELRGPLLDEPVLAQVRAEAERALSLLAAWDHVLGAESVPACLYELTQLFACRRVLEPLLGELTEPALGVGFHPLLDPTIIGYVDRTQLVVGGLLVDDERDWFSGRTRQQILAAALYDAIHYLSTTIGPRVEEWRWGAVHFAAFNHPLGAQPPLDRIFSRGPFPYGGDTHTVWQAAYVPKLPIAPEGGFTASWRQILDVGRWDASRGVHTTGQSGHPASPHYDDQIALWLEGRYHPLAWSRAAVDEQAEARLTLEPT